MTTRSKREPSLTQSEADDLIYDLYAIDGREKYDELAVKPFPRLPVRMAKQIIDGDIGGVDIAAMHAQWVTEDREKRAPGGRPPTITSRTMFIILLMHALANEPVSVRHMTTTLESRLTTDDMETIGLGEAKVEGAGWYYRLDSAYQTLMEPVDPYSLPKYPRNSPDRPPRERRLNRHHRLDGPLRVERQQFLKSTAKRRKRRQKRLDDLMFELNANLVRQAKAVGLLDGFNGDVALDATYTKVYGKASNRDLSRPARSTNLEAGAWGRQGNHFSEGPLAPGQKRTKGSATFLFGFETELVTMTPGKVAMPCFVLGVNLHRPGKIKKVARTLFHRIARLGFPAGTISVDRAYNGLTTEAFHKVLLHEGYEFAFDYKVGDLGIKTSFHHNGVGYVMIEGTWYIGLIPRALADANKHAALPANDPDHIDKETLTQRLEARKDYQLVRHGRRDADGFQRYRLPDPGGYIAYDADTGELLDKPTNKTVTIPMSVGLKWQQKHPYKSDEWKAAYHLRSEVERKNSQLKHTRFEALDDAGKRPTRGYTAHALQVAMLVVAHNVRTLDNYMRIAEGIDTKKSSRRQSRRSDSEKIHGVRQQRDGRSAA